MSNELPYEVYDRQGELVGAFPYDGFAEAFVEEVCWHDDRIPLEIVGPGERGEATDDGVPTPPDYDPDDVAFDDKARNGISKIVGKMSGAEYAELDDADDHNAEAMLGPEYDPDDEAFGDEFKAKLARGVTLRLVEVPAERPTIDAPVELTCHTVEFCEHYDGRFSMRCLGLDGDTLKIDCVGAGYMRLVRSARIIICNTQKDAPAPQRTVRDLRPGDVVHDEDAGWLICQVTEGGTFWQISRSQAWKLPVDQPIDKVYRFEVATCD